MDALTSLAVLAGALGLAAAALATLLVFDRRSARAERAAMRREMAAARDKARDEATALRAEVADLRIALKEAIERSERTTIVQRPPAPERPVAVITQVGESSAEVEVPARVISNQVLLSATFGEPLVKSLSFVHGVRRALSPVNRHRIAFEIKHGTKVARRQRRKDMRRAWRDARSGGRA